MKSRWANRLKSRRLTPLPQRQEPSSDRRVNMQLHWLQFCPFGVFPGVDGAASRSGLSHHLASDSLAANQTVSTSKPRTSGRGRRGMKTLKHTHRLYNYGNVISPEVRRLLAAAFGTTNVQTTCCITVSNSRPNRRSVILILGQMVPLLWWKRSDSEFVLSASVQLLRWRELSPLKDRPDYRDSKGPVMSHKELKSWPETTSR